MDWTEGQSESELHFMNVMEVFGLPSLAYLERGRAKVALRPRLALGWEGLDSHPPKLVTFDN
jgi:hypothetical protein